MKRSCANMRLAHRSQVVFAYINLKLPSLGDMAGYAESAWNSAFCVSQIHSPMISLLLYRCGLERPADCMSSLLPAITALSIYVASCTETSSPMTGWWVTGVTAPAGTSTSNLPYLVTNLATI
ncbi:MAG: hypothetical protein HZY79_00315 [Rhodoblastus sp.]|nr:MAG: hypothetical protein HZY79_00315 [Rhodoblastus sp.]